MAKLKPLPRAILVALVVGGIGYGANKYIDSRPKSPEIVQTTPTSVPPVEEVHVQQDPATSTAPQVESIQAAPAPAPDPQPVEETSANSGLDALLKKGSK